MPRLPGIFIVFAVASALRWSAASSQDQSDQPFVVNEAVEGKLLALTHEYRPKSVISTVRRSAETIIKANPDRASIAEALSTQVLQPNGLWATEFESKTSGTNTAARGFSLSLCGLITVATTAGASTGQDLTTLLPIGKGKLFLPFGFRMTTGFTRMVRVSSLDTSTSSLCSPLPGTEFSYRLRTEITTKTSGLGGRTQTSTQDEDVVCKVSADEKPANQLAAQFRGYFVDVTCEHKIGTNPPVQRDFIYLQDSGMYLMVALRETWGHSKITYKDVQYAN
jgi:hypothetical protein